MKKHIFAAKRGEGKTKWLINKALESQKNGKDICYVRRRYEDRPLPRILLRCMA